MPIPIVTPTAPSAWAVKHLRMFRSAVSRLVRRISPTRRFASDMPVPQSASAKLFQGHPQSEGWEFTIAWWYASSFVLIAMIQFLDPDDGIDVWAKQEARARLKLKAAGVTPEFGTHYQNLAQQDVQHQWDGFSLKALRMTDDDEDDDDDDDDDEEEEE